MSKSIRICILFAILFLLLTLNAFATNEEIITFEGITVEKPDVSTEIIESEDPINSVFISSRPADAVLDREAGLGIDNENVSDIMTKFSNETTVIGIDVSRHQGEINWKQVAESGVKFAIIRCGFRGTSLGVLYEDPTFDQNVKGALENGIYVGAYLYSTALNEEEALQEAYLVYNKIKDYDIKYPVYYDFEDFNPDNNRTDYMDVAQINANARIFMNYLKSKGYNAALYGSANYLKNKWESDITAEYDVWVAHYYVNKPNYSGQYQLWQYTDKAQVPGISTRVDVDVDYCYWANIKASVSTMSHIQTVGWEKTWKNDGETSGMTGKSKRLEAIKLKVNSNLTTGGIQYRTYIQENGWEKTWKKDGAISGTTGQSKRIEAIQIKLTGDISKFYDIYYRAHCQNYGWLGWAKNGECAGTEFLNVRIEAIQVKLILKSDIAHIPENSENKFIRLADVKYKSCVQKYGWMDYVINGELSGTTGQGLKIEEMSINLIGSGVNGEIEYRSHVQGIGWEADWSKNGQITGAQGQAKRIEAIQIRLTGNIADSYDIYYRTHCQNYGWLGWAKNGECAGTQGFGRRMEAIEILLIPKGHEVPNSTTAAFVDN